jgi:hypothetical protein
MLISPPTPYRSTTRLDTSGTIQAGILLGRIYKLMVNDTKNVFPKNTNPRKTGLAKNATRHKATMDHGQR